MNEGQGLIRGARDADCLSGGRAMGKFMRERDWQSTAVGPVEQWPQSLRTSVSILLESKFPMYIAWGEDYVQFYNDGYIPILGATKHPQALGISTRETFREIWPIIGPMFEDVSRGLAFGYEDFLLPLDRNGYLEECYFTFSYSPIRDETSQVGGIMVTTTETTARVIGERRLAMIGDLAALASQARSEEEIWTESANVLRRNPADLSFALLYRTRDARSFELEQSCGIGERSAAAPALLNAENEAACWPVSKILSDRQPVLVEDLLHRFGPVVGPQWPEPVQTALLLPIAKPGAESLYGILIVGISPRRALDDPYRRFLSLLADHIATGIGNVRAYDEERRRVEALAQLDRTKTEFFSNVSHEFRTPLTLMLGPLEEALKDSERLPREYRNHLATAHRNSLRLLKLVNSLLDFSRIEAGRIRGVYVPLDLAPLTADLCSNFRAAMEAAGLRFTVDCPPLGVQVFVDRDMWEKIVLNLLSNAFKFTLEGEVAVTLRTVGGAAELRVCDTGVGIPAEEMPRLFERFHRVPNARSRTHEGSGIGLALVQELAKLHGGAVRVESRLGRGSTFVVTLPLGSAHLPPEHIGSASAAASNAVNAAAFVEEALRWLPDNASVDASESVPAEEFIPAAHPKIAGGTRPRLLVADDNADMRHYLERILGERYDVQTVPDGESALEAARDRRPDLILSDVMMPRMDGIALLRELRADAALRTVPVILLSARAGEESRVEGLQERADDYLIKPFNARELRARVEGHIELAQLRRQSEEAIRQSERRYRSLFEHMLDGFAYCRMLYDEQGRPDDFVYLAVNDAFEKLTGLKDIVGKRVTEAIPGIKEAEPEIFEIYGRVASTGKPERFEIHFKPLAAYLSVSVYSPETGTFVAVFDNITERKRAEDALRDSEQQFRILIGNVQSAVALVNEQGEFTIVNSSFLRLFDVPPDVDIKNANSREWAQWQVFSEDGAPLTLDEHPARRAALTRQPVKNQLVAVRSPFHPDLKWMLVSAEPILDAQGKLHRLICTYYDITERKRAEQALREIEERFRALVTASSDVVYRINRDWTEMHQLVGREFVLDAREPNRNWLTRYIHPQDHVRVLAAVDEAIRTRSVVDLEHQVQRVDGAAGWTHLRAVPILDAGGEIVEWFGMASDITARKLADERLRQAQKTESIGVLAGGIAHDFNNLLVGVIGNASLLEEMLPPHDPAFELAQCIFKTGQQLAHLTRQMLAYSGRGRFFMEHLDLSTVVREIADLIRPTIPKKVSLHFELDDDLPQIEADRGQMQQVLMNLVINAAEAIGNHEGVITIVTEVRLVDSLFVGAHPEASDLRRGEYIALEVRDTGAGMDQSVKAKIFDPFFSTKFAGRGLGLAAVHGIVRGHSGCILVNSDPGTGSAFTILLPASGREVEVTQVAAPKKSSKGWGTVLVIDDEKIVRDMAKWALERNGYRVLLAYDGLSAIDIFKRHPGKIDVAVLDLSMPGMSGEETLPELRKIRPDVKVLVSSGYNQAEAMAMFDGQRVSGFVQKPYTAPALAEKVKGALE